MGSFSKDQVVKALGKDAPEGAAQAIKDGMGEQIDLTANSADAAHLERMGLDVAALAAGLESAEPKA